MRPRTIGLPGGPGSPLGPCTPIRPPRHNLWAIPQPELTCCHCWPMAGARIRLPRVARDLLMRMVKAGEIVRVGRGRYGPLRTRTHVVPPVCDAPRPAPPKPAAPKPVPADPGKPLRDELAKELIERRLGIKEEVEAPRPAFDFETFVAMIGGKYVRAGLCSPVRIRGLASSWIKDGIAPEHCLAVVDRHLREHAARSPSGSGDRLLSHLNDIIRETWDNRNTTVAPTRRPQTRPKPGNALDRWDDYRAKQRSDEPDCEGNYGGQ
jgi:hypothetical protein